MRFKTSRQLTSNFCWGSRLCECWQYILPNVDNKIKPLFYWPFHFPIYNSNNINNNNNIFLFVKWIVGQILLSATVVRKNGGAVTWQYRDVSHSHLFIYILLSFHGYHWMFVVIFPVFPFSFSSYRKRSTGRFSKRGASAPAHLFWQIVQYLQQLVRNCWNMTRLWKGWTIPTEEWACVASLGH